MQSVPGVSVKFSIVSVDFGLWNFVISFFSGLSSLAKKGPSMRCQDRDLRLNSTAVRYTPLITARVKIRKTCHISSRASFYWKTIVVDLDIQSENVKQIIISLSHLCYTIHSTHFHPLLVAVSMISPPLSSSKHSWIISFAFTLFSNLFLGISQRKAQEVTLLGLFISSSFNALSSH